MSILLSKTTLNGVSTANINISPGFDNLVIRMAGKSDYTCGMVSLGLQLNGDHTSALYYWVWNEARATPGDPGCIMCPASGEGGEARIRIGLWPGAQRIAGFASSPAGMQNGILDPCNGLWYDSIHPPATTGAPNAIGFCNVRIPNYATTGPLKPVEFDGGLWNGVYNNMSSITGFGIWNDQAAQGSPITSITPMLDVGKFVNTVVEVYAE